MFIPPFAGQKVWTGVAGLAAPNGSLTTRITPSRILVDEHMRALAFDSIFAIGAAVRLPACVFDGRLTVAKISKTH
ncbi:hypothetical protein T484DRAFT_1870309 [Baffinella frigidus]|nr:hypothetical protein T484DRAFT_1870309 [Cryptophyta sp. CCMP2293]